ncbi:SRPBCC family protein [Pseudopontixanthobacter vadosimaris]|uniref:SRPBCC family protein n=1 Tax=Pseudopontixanthobacter vadosimaris TaxID=2726450 RepID=UPI001474C049|nr:SRPBCC family protein [Pseudopontixanthobacter vadosimaris]
MRHDRDKGLAGAAVGVGLALGGLAFGAFLTQRRKGGGDDAPFYTRKSPERDDAVLGRTVTIRKPRAELYEFWRDFGNLPQFMENVETIRSEGDHRVWTIKAPAGRTVDVRTEVSEDTQNERIAWRSVEGSDIETSGSVEFTDAPGDRGTRVSLVMSYDPPAGELGRAVAKLFMREPEVQARHDLKRLKMLMETGEIATSARTKDETRKAKQQENG